MGAARATLCGATLLLVGVWMVSPRSASGVPSTAAPLAPEPLEDASLPQQPQPEPRKLTATGRPLDLVFGVVAFDPKVRCGAGCDRTPYYDGVRRWVRSVRRHTDASTTEIALLTGEGAGSVAADSRLAAYLASESVRVVGADFRDAAGRVAHADPSRYVWCVVRNRWFAIAQLLGASGDARRYRYVLMSDTKDAVLQADPFAWISAHAAAGGVEPADVEPADVGIFLSGEGSGKVKTLRQSKKGRPRTLKCVRDATEFQRRGLLETEPLNAGVTMGGATSFRNFSAALAGMIAHVTTATCLDVKDCTDQGLYNQLAYLHWPRLLPHTRRHVMPMEKAPSYTLGHKPTCPKVDALTGHVINDNGHVPPVVHQYAKGAAGRALRTTPFTTRYLRALNDGTAGAGAAAG